MYRYEFVIQQYDQLVATYRPEIAHLRQWENEKATYEAQISAMQSAVVGFHQEYPVTPTCNVLNLIQARNPFVV